LRPAMNGARADSGRVSMRPGNFRCAFVTGLLVCVCFGLTVLRSFAADDELAQRIKRWHTLYQNRAETLAPVEKKKDEEIKLTLVATPLQSFSNSVRPDDMHGTVHLWTLNGRPQMIGSVWSAFDQKNRAQRNLCYEFYNLSEWPLDVRVTDNASWTPKEGGIEWIALKDADPPAKSRPLRLAQMRRLMAEVRGEIDTGESELRMLSQPIYRYPETVPDVVDGAIFSFVMGTDPEIFVQLEARIEKVDAQPTWSLAPIRFTGSGILLKRHETIIWQRGVWENFSRDKVYDFLYGVEHLNAVDPDQPVPAK